MPNKLNPKMCPMDRFIAFVSKKWMLFIVTTIANGAKTYSDIANNTYNINSSILSSRLKELQEYGFIEKKIISQTPIKVEYSLTEKGRTFSKEFAWVIDWAEKWM